MTCHHLLSCLWLAMHPAAVSAFAIRPLLARPSSTRHPPALASTKGGDDVPELPPHFSSPSTLDWLQKMAASYKLERGEELLDVILRESTAVSSSDDTSHALNNLAIAIATTNLPIASHDFLRDETIYCYGNLAFLEGFGYSWDEFVELPSRKCVTEEEVSERQRLLDEVKANAMNGESSEGGGYSAPDYDNLIRIRKDGRRILLRDVNLWNCYDISPEDADTALKTTRAGIESGDIKAIGQAVWIRHVDFLDETS